MTEILNPVQIWRNAMTDNFKDKPVMTPEEEIKMKRKEQARKTAAALLAKNPNHFKELNAKARAKKEQK